MRKATWKYVLVVIVFVISLYFLYPTLKLYLTSSEARERNPLEVQRLQMKAIKLGLDLQGGVHIVLEVDTTKLPEEIAQPPIDEALEVIRSRVDQFGVAEPVIQKAGERRIIVELPGIQDIEQAKTLIQETALLEFRLMRDARDVNRFVSVLDKYLSEHPEIIAMASGSDTSITIPSAGSDTTQPTMEVVAQPSDTQGKPQAPKKTMGDLLAQKSDSGKTLKGEEIFGADTLAGKEETEEEIGGPKPFSSIVIVEDNDIFVPISHVDMVSRLIEMPEIKALFPKGSKLFWSAHARELRTQNIKVKELFVLNEKPELTGQYLTDANWRLGDEFNAAAPVVNLTFDSRGGQIFSRVTGANIKRRLAIVLNDKVYTAPVIETKISNGRARITGIRSIDEAKVISIVLRAGSLPVPLKIIEERTVGPSLGEDSIKSGVSAALIGLIVVVIFMVIYYYITGFIANVALMLNMVILLAAMSLFNATLTLPGIAGIILTMGMALDANVLINERIREEIRAGRTLKMAIEAGYSKAFLTIVDSNLTTIAAAIVLYYFGTGPIRGFAVTLSLGLVASMFTAIMVTRLILDWYVSAFKVERLRI